ncbi:MAG: DUF2207 domain-containing protein, partial [Imperialibacter sp.]|uniref:DUF2207 domain-containing protein n=1 Tax=Imperialibacter sp. TaxID=2038411 RepID=UPI0032EF7452
MKKLVTLLLGGLFFSGLSAQESIISPHEEHIISYESDISINVDASIDVVETIKVYANGTDIRRGIYRFYQVDYADEDGFSYSVDFDVLEVLKDGV